MNLAYQITIRRIATGSDYRIRLFASDMAKAQERATERARNAYHMPYSKFRELKAKGVAVFRVVSCEVSLDQTRPIA